MSSKLVGTFRGMKRCDERPVLLAVRIPEGTRAQVKIAAIEPRTTVQAFVADALAKAAAESRRRVREAATG